MGRGLSRSARSAAQEDRGHPIGRRQHTDAHPCRREGGAISLSRHSMFLVGCYGGIAESLPSDGEFKKLSFV